MRSQHECPGAACHPTSLVWWIEQGFSPLAVVQRQLELFSEKVMPEYVGEEGAGGPAGARSPTGTTEGGAV